MIRAITGFHQDDDGDWVAELSCLHNQHVRHRPPFLDRPWVTTAEGRNSRLGTPIACPLCDRAELPADLCHVRTAGPFDHAPLPAGLRRDHRVAAGLWARLRVLEGSVRFTMASEPPVDVVLRTGDEQPIPPDVLHAVEPGDGARIAADFLGPTART
jgi:tellurite methyltransferase